jgi:hypothetical protein
VERLSRYRFDFVVPDTHDINEPDEASQNNPTLDQVRAALAENARWERSMLAPWRPYGQQQHLIIWIDLTKQESEMVIQDAVTDIVRSILPSSDLVEMVKNPT